jgi:glutathione synthase/RimK-type ligase-like ATP-grasp enzyme
MARKGVVGTVGNGLCCVDIKQTAAGDMVIEVNDNPNIEHGIEDAVAGSGLWKKILAALASR